MNNAPCYHCTDREGVCRKYGNCHNEHCPNGYLKWQEEHRELVARNTPKFTSGVKHSKSWRRK